MARGSFFAGMMKSGALAAALLAGAAVPGYAGDAPKLALTGSATMTTDYMFRSISNTSQNPAVQPEFDLTYGIFWAYIWGSNTAFGEGIEIDYGGGISPKWGPVTFTFAGFEYTYPGETSNPNIDYFEAKGGASWTTGAWTLAVNNYWSPDNFQIFGNSYAIDGTLSYAWTKKLWGFFTPSISGQFGFQSYEEIADDYTYWNAGLTLGFLEHWSADIRYYDTDYGKNECLIQSGARDNCDARAVGTIKATF
jgi:uncharacterized protein (TIGR02001 family)